MPQNSSSWSRIKSMPLDESGRLTLASIIAESHQSGDAATLIAAMRSLGRSTQGRHDLAALRILLFGGSPLNPKTRQINLSIKTKLGQDTYLWEKAMEGIDTSGAPDLIKPESSAFGDLTAEKLVQWESQTVIRYVDYINRLRQNADNASEEGRNIALAQLRNAIQELRAAHQLALELDHTRARYTPDSRRVVEQYLSAVREED